MRDFRMADVPPVGMIDALAARSVGSLSHRERAGVRGCGLAAACTPLTPALSPNGERERTESAAPLARHSLLVLMLASLLISTPALSQTSQKPIQIIVPFAPGASADGAARIVANELGPRLGRQVVVENKAGAGGSLGLQMVAKSAPDGDTLGVGASGALLLNPNLPVNPGPDLLRDLTPVAKIIDIAIVLVANATSGPKTIQEMIARSKATPGGLTYGSTGANTSQHISIELLKQATGANLVHVPYRGSAPAVVDVLAGQIPLASVDLTSAYPHIQSGRLIALGLADSKRFPVTPEIPTIAEGGVPGFGRASGFIGLFAPAGTPSPVVRKISREVAAILATPAAQATARTLTSAAAYQDEEAFGRFLSDESVKWKQALSSLDLSN
jgi:tripartite-type tricarboxylate transporter receptor subunit TctC